MLKYLRILTILGLLQAVFLSSSHAFPVADSADLGAAKSLSISVGEWPPFLSADLPHYGVAGHLIKDVFHNIGYHVSFTFLPWARAYQATANSRYDATAVWMHQVDREKDFLYSEPVLKENFVFFYHKDNPLEWDSLADLKGKLVGGALAYSYGPAFDQAVKDNLFTMLRVSSTEQNLRMLAAGRIDFFAEELSVAYYTLLNNTPELAGDILHHPKRLLVNQSYLLFPKSDPSSAELAAAFNEQLEAFKEDGRYQAYFDRLRKGYYRPSQRPASTSSKN